jgi:hypothetical protein
MQIDPVRFVEQLKSEFLLLQCGWEPVAGPDEDIHGRSDTNFLLSPRVLGSRLFSDPIAGNATQPSLWLSQERGIGDSTTQTPTRGGEKGGSGFLSLNLGDVYSSG